jgi:exportin-1
LIGEEKFKLVIDSIQWAFQHVEKNIADAGLNTLFELLANVERSDMINHFYKTYVMPLLEELFVMLTDKSHKSGFQLHCAILAKIFQTVDSGVVTVPMFDTSAMSFPNNQTFIRQHMVDLIGTSFANLSPHDVARFVEGLFAYHSNQQAFLMHMRDFLVQFKEWSGEGGAELFSPDREAQLAALRQAEADRVASVPGLFYEAHVSDLYRADRDGDEEED